MRTAVKKISDEGLWNNYHLSTTDIKKRNAVTISAVDKLQLQNTTVILHCSANILKLKPSMKEPTGFVKEIWNCISHFTNKMALQIYSNPIVISRIRQEFVVVNGNPPAETACCNGNHLCHIISRHLSPLRVHCCKECHNVSENYTYSTTAQCCTRNDVSIYNLLFRDLKLSRRTKYRLWPSVL